MNKARKIGGILLCFVSMTSNIMPVLAAESVESDNTMIQEIITIESVEEEIAEPEEADELLASNPLLRDGQRPSQTWNVSTSGQYDFEYSVYLNNTCFSGYNFTGVTEAVLFVNSASDTGVVSKYEIRIYKNKALLPDTLIGTHKCSTDTDHLQQLRISNMDENAKYYFEIVPSETYLSGHGHFKEG